jgi:hypothetical protein
MLLERRSVTGQIRPCAHADVSFLCAASKTPRLANVSNLQKTVFYWEVGISFAKFETAVQGGTLLFLAHHCQQCLPLISLCCLLLGVSRNAQPRMNVSLLTVLFIAIAYSRSRALSRATGRRGRHKVTHCGQLHSLKFHADVAGIKGLAMLFTTMVPENVSLN